VANAENNANLKLAGLVVKEAVVGEGPTFKRIMARARGSASRILKRTSHIRIVLTDEIPIENRETRKARRKSKEKPVTRQPETSQEQAKSKPASVKKTGKKKKAAGRK
jgi:large subunit ribosomal protein L22